MMAAEMRTAITSTRRARLGAVLQRRPLRELRDRFSSDTYGGGVLLGLNGTVVIAHGASNARAVTAACLLAHDLAQGRIVERIRDQVVGPRTSRFGRRAPGEQSRTPGERPAERADSSPAAEERFTEPPVIKEGPAPTAE